MKTGDIIFDKINKRKCIIVSKYKGKGNFDFEIFAIGSEFNYAHLYQDCRKRKDLEKCIWYNYDTSWRGIYNMIVRKLRSRA